MLQQLLCWLHRRSSLRRSLAQLVASYKLADLIEISSICQPHLAICSPRTPSHSVEEGTVPLSSVGPGAVSTLCFGSVMTAPPREELHG